EPERACRRSGRPIATAERYRTRRQSQTRAHACLLGDKSRRQDCRLWHRFGLLHALVRECRRQQRPCLRERAERPAEVSEHRQRHRRGAGLRVHPRERQRNLRGAARRRALSGAAGSVLDCAELPRSAGQLHGSVRHGGIQSLRLCRPQTGRCIHCARSRCGKRLARQRHGNPAPHRARRGAPRSRSRRFHVRERKLDSRQPGRSAHCRSVRCVDSRANRSVHHEIQKAEFLTRRFNGEPMRLITLLGSGVAVACLAFSTMCRSEDTPAKPAMAERDGSHDFDFAFGAWKTHIRRRVHALSASNEMIELNGTVNARKVWDGRAQLEEIETDGPKGHWEGATLFMYNPGAHQWSMTFINSSIGTFTNGLIGSFKDGRAELFATDTLDGRAILVRGTWSNLTPTTHRYEEAYSADGGKTWETELTADKTKATPADIKPVSNDDGSHDFDFDF